MKVMIFTTGDGQESRDAMELGDKIRVDVENVVFYNWEDEEAAQIATLYDIYKAPAVLITKDDGGFVELWQGDLPVAGDVIYRAKNG